jgi:HPt (histidine-containing phosphotransfer) domain-containing protein
LVALTSQTCRSERQACLAAGADACISRPLDPGGFVEIVDHLREAHHPVVAHAGNNVDSVTHAPQDEDDRLFRRLQIALIESTRLSIEKLRKAIETRESVTIHQMAQGVRGALVLFKADRAAVRAAELEESGARGDLRKAKQLMPKLAAEVSAALAKARNQLRESPVKQNRGRNGKDRHPSGATEGGA